MMNDEVNCIIFYCKPIEIQFDITVGCTKKIKEIFLWHTKHSDNYMHCFIYKLLISSIPHLKTILRKGIFVIQGLQL